MITNKLCKKLNGQRYSLTRHVVYTPHVHPHHTTCLFVTCSSHKLRLTCSSSTSRFFSLPYRKYLRLIHTKLPPLLSALNLYNLQAFMKLGYNPYMMPILPHHNSKHDTTTSSRYIIMQSQLLMQCISSVQ